MQVGTRVSTLASVFDSKFGVAWSRATFGVAGASTRIYGTIKELLTEGRGKQTFYRVKWDSDLVPTHDSTRGPNSAAPQHERRRSRHGVRRLLTTHLYLPRPSLGAFGRHLVFCPSALHRWDVGTSPARAPHLPPPSHATMSCVLSVQGARTPACSMRQVDRVQQQLAGAVCSRFHVARTWFYAL